ncbi:stress protein [Bacillus mangrovi]|uniref:Stress protein n=1 Tax=Metabacillus mangrovi TaxID=1491830 RepID=A0A7X2V389_9BACI|nr:stress protein [Metabacillus mangrovi]MTH51869.1 stress protein [Metabacillus mangrovi]
MKKKQAAVSSALGLAMLVTPLALPASEESTASAKAAGAAAEIPVDPVAIGEAIADAVKTADNRSGFVKGAMENAFYAAGQQHNVMVMNLSQGYDEQLNGVKFFETVEYDGVTFGVWVFEDGKFTNEGDGGYINWSFRGWFERNDRTVEFSRP